MLCSLWGAVSHTPGHTQAQNKTQFLFWEHQLHLKIWLGEKKRLRRALLQSRPSISQTLERLNRGIRVFAHAKGLGSCFLTPGVQDQSLLPLRDSGASKLRSTVPILFTCGPHILFKPTKTHHIKTAWGQNTGYTGVKGGFLPMSALARLSTTSSLLGLRSHSP